MRKSTSTIMLLIVATIGLFAQKKEQDEKFTFHLSPEMVKVYDHESATTGFTLIDVFEDEYNLKLTKKLYKVRLKFAADKMPEVQKLVSEILDGNKESSGYETMVWKKTTSPKRPMYEVELNDNKLKIKVYRKEMNAQAYQVINDLGEAFLRKINS